VSAPCLTDGEVADSFHTVNRVVSLALHEPPKQNKIVNSLQHHGPTGTLAAGVARRLRSRGTGSCQACPHGSSPVATLSFYSGSRHETTQDGVRMGTGRSAGTPARDFRTGPDAGVAVSADVSNPEPGRLRRSSAESRGTGASWCGISTSSRISLRVRTLPLVPAVVPKRDRPGMVGRSRSTPPGLPGQGPRRTRCRVCTGLLGPPISGAWRSATRTGRSAVTLAWPATLG
jgi:hypothetical protein